MKFCSSEYIPIFGKGEVLELVDTNITCLVLGEAVDNCHVITEMRALIPVSLHSDWLLWFLQYLKQGWISLASKIPLKQDSSRMLRLLLRRVLSLPPVSNYIEPNKCSTLCYEGIVFLISECFTQYFKRNWPECKFLWRLSALKTQEELFVPTFERL